MKCKRGHYTPKQKAYAIRTMQPTNKSKTQIAIEVGYSRETAKQHTTHIEGSEGYKIAMAEIVEQTGNVMMGLYYRLTPEKLDSLTTQEIIRSIDTFSKVYERMIPAQDKAREMSTLKAIFQRPAIIDTQPPGPPAIESLTE